MRLYPPFLGGISFQSGLRHYPPKNNFSQFYYFNKSHFLLLFILFIIAQTFVLKIVYAYFLLAIICLSSLDLILHFADFGKKSNVEISQNNNDASSEENQNYEKDGEEKDKIFNFHTIKLCKLKAKKTKISQLNQIVYAQNHPQILDQPPKINFNS